MSIVCTRTLDIGRSYDYDRQFKRLNALRKRELAAIAHLNKIPVPTGARKDDMLPALAVHSNLRFPGDEAEPDASEYELAGLSRQKLMAMAKKLDLKTKSTMKHSEVLKLVEAALDE